MKSVVNKLARRTAIKTAIKKVLVALEEGQDTSALLSDVAAKLARAKKQGRYACKYCCSQIEPSCKAWQLKLSVNLPDKLTFCNRIININKKSLSVLS